MPESIEFYEYKVEEAKMKHEFYKQNPDKREHSFSLTYAKKAVNEAEKNLEIAKNSDFQAETETKEQAKPLFLVMQKVWFDAIENGSKIEEYRDGTEFYFSRLCNRDKTGKILSLKNFKTAILQEGYHAGARRMKIEISKISYDGDFTIHLGKILERINF